MSERRRPVVTLHLDGTGRGSVEIDGVRVPNVRSVEVRSCIREVTTVTLELVGVRIEGSVTATQLLADTSTTDTGMTRHFDPLTLV